MVELLNRNSVISTQASVSTTDKIEEKLQSISIDNVVGSVEENSGSNSNKSDRCNEISSNVPTEFNEVDNLFHIDFMQSMQSLLSQQRRFKNGTRRSCTFSNEKMRQIERENRILLNKILAQKPSSSTAQRPQNGIIYQSRSSSASRVSSAAINRRQEQERIDFDNSILKMKIERITRRNLK